MSYTPHSTNANIVHDLSWFGDFNELLEGNEVTPNEDGIAVYSAIPVTLEKFQTEVSKNLYKLEEFDTSGIPDDCALITFSYRTEHETPILIEEENISIIQDGERGVDGKSAYEIAVEEGFNGTEEQYAQRGSKYLGCYTDSLSAYEDNKIDIFVKDYYLNSTDGYIYRVNELNETSATYEKLEADSYPELYSSVMNDAISNISQDSETLPIVKAMNSWIQTLTAKTAFIENLFAQNITMQEKGIIKSKNYNGTISNNGQITKIGNKGWAIDYNGFADFNDVNISGSIETTNLTIKGIEAGSEFLCTIYEPKILHLTNSYPHQNTIFYANLYTIFNTKGSLFLKNLKITVRNFVNVGGFSINCNLGIYRGYNDFVVKGQPLSITESGNNKAISSSKEFVYEMDPATRYINFDNENYGIQINITVNGVTTGSTKCDVIINGDLYGDKKNALLIQLMRSRDLDSIYVN